MITRLLVCATAITCILTILFFVTNRSSSADFTGDWLLEDLTCEELISGYEFEVEMVDQIRESWEFCKAYAESPADAGHGLLHCALLKKEGMYVAGLGSAIADVYSIKCKAP